MKSQLFGAMCAVLFTFTTPSATAAFFGRLPTTPGGTDFQAYYDDQLDITWTADASISGRDTQENHVVWVTDLDINGVTEWRLPNSDINGDNDIISCFGGGVLGCADNEMGFLYWEEGITSATPGEFSNVLNSTIYSSGTESATPGFFFALNFSDGNQIANSRGGLTFAWAVHDCDVGAVPVPAAAWLFGSGLLGLARHKR